jgi:hypothetical protein
MSTLFYALFDSHANCRYLLYIQDVENIVICSNPNTAQT